jgi:hypothetical protein
MKKNVGSIDRAARIIIGREYLFFESSPVISRFNWRSLPSRGPA